MVGIPAKGADQIPITQLIDQWGAGRALPGDAGALQIRAAVEELLSSSDFRSEAQRRSLAFAGKDGAQLAASSVESLLPRGA
jgi:UDP:flavonoid glycosyltransferase YjiC (YdhE family)